MIHIINQFGMNLEVISIKDPHIMDAVFAILNERKLFATVYMKKSLKLTTEKIKAFFQVFFKNILKIFCVYPFFYES